MKFLNSNINSSVQVSNFLTSNFITSFTYTLSYCVPLDMLHELDRDEAFKKELRSERDVAPVQEGLEDMQNRRDLNAAFKKELRFERDTDKDIAKTLLSAKSEEGAH